MTGPASGPDLAQRVRDHGLLVALCALWVLAGGLWLALFIGARLAGTPLPGNPVTVVLEFVSGQIPWPGLGATLALGCELLIVVSLARVVWQIRRTRTRTRVDRVAGLLGRGREIEEYTEAGVAKSVARLRPTGHGPDPSEHGMLLGKTVAPPRQAMRMSWENTSVLLAGPRRGKTTCYVIPQIIEAPGPVLTTSLRRDVWDASVDLRAERGQVWNFDPQQLITSEDPTWWFDPLANIHSIDDARKLKDHFVMGTRGPNATTSAYFDGEGEQLLARMILAAAHKDGGSLLNVYNWVNEPGAIEPVTLLRQAGQHQAAAGLNRIRTLSAEKQRDGVYGAAAALVNCLENPLITRWVTPPSDRAIRRFDPDAFVRCKDSTDTLYLHSREGEGNVSPLIAALTQEVFDAGLRRASRSPGGRLNPPVLGKLDEAANVCKIKNLPGLYSYLGGSGIPVDTILQSFEQGKDVWGENGMRMLFGAATVRIYAGGLAEPESLRRFSELLGPWDQLVASVSYDDRGHRSVSYQPRTKNILEISELADLPRGRAIVFAAGIRATLVEPQPWMNTAHAPKIHASIAAHSPDTDTDKETEKSSSPWTTGPFLPS